MFLKFSAFYGSLISGSCHYHYLPPDDPPRLLIVTLCIALRPAVYWMPSLYKPSEDKEIEERASCSEIGFDPMFFLFLPRCSVANRCSIVVRVCLCRERWELFHLWPHIVKALWNNKGCSVSTSAEEGIILMGCLVCFSRKLGRDN